MKIAFIGGGNMGEAIIASLLGKKLCKPGDISVSELIEARRDYLKTKYNVSVTAHSKRSGLRERCYCFRGKAPEY